MKVLYVTQYFSSNPLHASAVTTYEIVTRLAQRGHKVSVISACSPGNARIYEGNAKSCQCIKVLPIPEFSPQWYDGFTTFFTHTLTHVPMTLGGLSLYQSHEKFDIIISMFHPTHLATVSARLLSMILKVPLATKIHDFVIETLEPNMLKRAYHVLLGKINYQALKGSDAILVLSPELMDIVRKEGGIDEKKLVVFPNGVDTSFFKPGIQCDELRKKLGLEGKKIILFLGVQAGRHPELLIKGLPNIAHRIKNFKLLFVGDGPEKYRLSLSSLAKSLGVGDFVEYAGSVKHSRVPEYISLADVTIGPLSLTYDPAVSGSFPLKVLEYMACGKPVVACRGAVSESLIMDGYNGVLCEPGDVHGLSSAIVKVLEDQSFSEFIGRNARKHMEKMASWDVLIPRLEKLLASVVNSIA